MLMGLGFMRNLEPFCISCMWFFLVCVDVAYVPFTFEYKFFGFFIIGMVGVGWGRMVYYYRIYLISGWNDILFAVALNLESVQKYLTSNS